MSTRREFPTHPGARRLEETTWRRVFPLRYLYWKGRMAWNLLRGRRELLTLSTILGLSGLLGLSFWWVLADRGLERILGSASAVSSLEIAFFAGMVAFFLMALARVLAGFFSAGRAHERDVLLGAVTPNTLFVTEALDALLLPGVLALLAGAIPLMRMGLTLEMPLAGVLGIGLSVLLLGGLPTLLVLTLTMGGIRLIPRAWLGRQGLLFSFFFGVSGLGAGALSLVRAGMRTGGAELLSLMPSAAVAQMLPAWKNGALSPVWQGLGLLSAGCAVLFLSSRWLYTRVFLPHPERYMAQPDAQALQAGHEPDARLRRLLRGRVSAPVVAVALKDWRSARRDTASRLAFTGLLAFLLALACVDVALGSMNAVVFLPILWAYASFLLSCQGLSTFAAEGGVLEGLAILPLSPKDILKAKVLSHAMLFGGLNLGAVCVFVLAPSPMPLWARAFSGAFVLAGLLPLGAVLAFVTVTLGAVFPKPGAGGGRKEISLFAMGLFGQLVGMGVLSGIGVVGAPLVFGWPGLLVPLTLGPAWLLTLFMLASLAIRAIDRALGSSMKLS